MTVDQVVGIPIILVPIATNFIHYDLHTVADVADAIGVTMMPASDDPGGVLSVDLTGKRGPVVITKPQSGPVPRILL